MVVVAGLTIVLVVGFEQHHVLRFDADGQTTTDSLAMLALRLPRDDRLVISIIQVRRYQYARRRVSLSPGAWALRWRRDGGDDRARRAPLWDDGQLVCVGLAQAAAGADLRRYAAEHTHGDRRVGPVR